MADTKGKDTPGTVSVVDPADIPGADLEDTLPQEELKRPPLSSLVGVKYDGAADVRRITAKQFRAAGVQELKTEDTLEWNSVNGYVVSKDLLYAETVDFLIKQPGFSVV